MASSPNHSHNESSDITTINLNPCAPLFFPRVPSLYYNYYFSSPPPTYYFITNTNLPPPPPPPSLLIYYPFWFSNPNPNQRFSPSTQEISPLHLLNPNQEMSPPPRTIRRRVYNGRRGSYGYRKKGTWKRQVHHHVESNDDYHTTVMLRNIPNKYTRDMMIDFLDRHCEEENKKEKDEEFAISAYDFLYLPIDFKRNMNKGYAFVNFTNAEAVSKFKATCNNMSWTFCGSRKILEIAYARIQGKDELVKHFEQMTYPVEEYSAVQFSPARTGPDNTVQTIMVGKCT
ncbi:unnamed protein product [Cochlearia groenlandica]